MQIHPVTSDADVPTLPPDKFTSSSVQTSGFKRFNSKTNFLDRSSHGGTLMMQLGPPQLRLLWLGTWISHAFCGAFYGLSAALYAFLLTPDMDYYVQLLMPSPSVTCKTAVVLFSLLAAAHAWYLLEMTWSTLVERRFLFDGSASVRAAERNRFARWLESSLSERARQAWDVIRSTWQALFGRQGVFGVESGYFDVRFVLREGVEIVSQTIQVYYSSVLVGKAWINHLYVFFIVLNCWSTPLVQYFTRRSLALERLSCLIMDALLDSGTSLIMPLVIIWPYAIAFDPVIHEFEISKVYNDVWYISMVNENRQIIAQSVPDLLNKFISYLGVFSCLASVPQLVKISHNNSAVISAVSVRFDSIDDDKNAAAVNKETFPPEQLKRVAVRRVHGKVAHLVHFLFFVWGLGILILHLTAVCRSWNDSTRGCRVPLRPWLAKKYACAVYEFNCYREVTASVANNSLDFLAESSLSLLLVTHCPALTMPRNIQKFSNLIGVDIYNCTIASWPLEAGITQTTHPAIVYVYVALSNMSSIPDGLMFDLPKTLFDIEISTTNLSVFPADLDEHWQHVTTLYVEHMGLQHVPEPLLRMRTTYFSLLGNNITAIPAMPCAGSYESLVIARNPISEMPTALDHSKLSFLSIENTLVTALPNWIHDLDDRGGRVYAIGSTFCDSLSSSERDQHFGLSATDTCEFPDPLGNGQYPLEITRVLRPL